MANYKVRTVEDFIRRGLPSKLQNDLRALKMVRESDLESSIYFHIRSFLERDDNWCVLTRKHAKRTGHFIDVLLFKREKPRIALELKWNRDAVDSKDLGSLRKAIHKLNVNRAYYIATITNGQLSSRKTFKVPIERQNILGIFIPLGFSSEENRAWNQRRRKYTSRMDFGTAKHTGAA